MSGEDVWYFLRGEEQVGPFSKEIIRQIHEGGQLTAETLVWREGLPNWEPAGSVAELELGKPVAAEPPPAAPAPAAPGGPVQPSGENAPKLKLAKKIPEIPPPGSPSPIPAAVPQALPPVAAAPAPALTLKTVERSEFTPETAPNVLTVETPLQKTLNYFKSSLFVAPLFLIVAGGLFMLYSDYFPSAMGFQWLVIILTGFGVLSISGIHGLDGVVRIIALLFLIPVIILIWPAIMSYTKWTDIPSSQWLFICFCLFYCMTTRIGLRGFIPAGLDKFAIGTGLLTLGLILTIGNGIWRPEGWDQFVDQGNNMRIPAKWARWIGKPEWGSEAGHLYLRLTQNTQHGIESAVLRRDESNRNTGILRIQTMDGILISVKFASEEHSTFSLDKLPERPWPILFNVPAYEDLSDSGVGFITLDGDQIPVANGQFVIKSMKDDVWEATIQFKVESSNPRVPKKMTGSFKSRIVSRIVD